MIQDLNDQKGQTERIRDLLRTTLSSIGDAVISTDAQGRISFFNPVAEALTGWSQSEGAGKPLEEVFAIVNENTRAGREPGCEGS